MMLRTVVISVSLMLACSSLMAQRALQVNGGEYTLHQVQAGETFYSLSVKYDVLLDSLNAVNRVDSATTINIGDMLIIPLHASKKADAGKVEVKPAADYLIHVVKTGETLYSIARTYTYTSVATIKEVNALMSDTVKIGQQLKIPKPGDSGMIQPPTEDGELFEMKAKLGIDSAALFDPGKLVLNTTEWQIDNVDVRLNDRDVEDEALIQGYDMDMLADLEATYRKQDTLVGKVETTRGAALWFDDPSEQNQTKFYVLHKTAAKGTVMEVRNLMNNRKVYVKVIGRLPETGEHRNVILKMSAACAKYLNVLDEKFLVEVSEHPAKS